MQFSPLKSVRARVVLLNVVILSLLLGALGASLPPLVRAAMIRSIDRDQADRAMRFADRIPREPGQIPGAPNPNAPHRPEGEGHPPDQQDGNGPLNNPPPPGRGPNGQPPPNGGPGGRRPEDPSTTAGTRLNPREIPLRPIVDGPAPPTPWDANAFSQAAGRQNVYSTVHVDGEAVRVFSMPFPPRGEVGSVIQVPYPLVEVERAISGLTNALWMFAPVALLVAGLGGYLLTGSALKPVERITQTASMIGAKDMSRRIPVDGEDEFARLAMTFNSMLARLDVAFSERERLISELKEMVERQRRFTADASHELKTPLTAIKANTSLLLSGAPSLADYRESAEEIDTAASSMTRLVQDLLLLAQSDSGQLALHPVITPLDAILQRAATQVRKSASAVLSVNVETGILVSADEQALTRLFGNLLDNAARHTPAEGSIVLRARRRDNLAVVNVIDTGSGIAPEHMAHLGERFYRVDTHRARSYGGTGLGLAICREIVAAHNGTIEFASEVGKGTTVTVTLPLAKGE